MEKWNTDKSTDLYGIANWGDGFFRINQAGHVEVRPSGNGKVLDMQDLVTSLVERGVELPVLIRFDGIIRERVRRLQSAFEQAIKEFNYSGKYQLVYPIKVNQQRHVVDTVRLAGRDYQLGLEVGSKPELIAVLAVHDTPGALLLCNGYKDAEYIELALLANRAGRRSIIIIEQFSELNLVLQASERLGIPAEIGVRMKPVSRGSGRWEASSGDYAKFGLSTTEIMQVLRELKKHGKTDFLKLLHFHIGSQITSIAAIQRTLAEATRMYTEIHKACPSLCTLDVGGGLAVDYDGSRTNFESSMNYTVEEYARDIVSAIGEACERAGVPAPMIVSESGRAIVAHHSVLVGQVIDVSPTLESVSDLGEPPSEHEMLQELIKLYNNVSVKNCHESLNDALLIKDDILQRFIQGTLTLEERAYADKSFWHLVSKIKLVSRDLKYIPEDLERLDDKLRDTYFCNFSLFQSLPDSWAIDQLFPVMPIQRLNEEPLRRAIMADISCDSDGQIDRFIDLKDVKKYVRFHDVKTTEPYYFGIFLVGAYQEILGDLHNLFGDTNAVHVDVNGEGRIEITQVVPGDTVREVLQYVQYDPADLIERLRISVEKALNDGVLTPVQSAQLQKKFKEALEEYTYLNPPE